MRHEPPARDARDHLRGADLLPVYHDRPRAAPLVFPAWALLRLVGDA